MLAVNDLRLSRTGPFDEDYASQEVGDRLLRGRDGVIHRLGHVGQQRLSILDLPSVGALIRRDREGVVVAEDALQLFLTGLNRFERDGRQHVVSSRAAWQSTRIMSMPAHHVEPEPF